MRSPETPANSPIATIGILAVTGIVTGMQLVFPEVLPALERTPTALANHEWWRLLSPLLVHGACEIDADFSQRAKLAGLDLLRREADLEQSGQKRFVKPA